MPTNPSNKIKSKPIDEVIIRLLGLTVGLQLDEQTYYELLKKKLFSSRLGGKKLPDEEDELLRNELKTVKRKIDSTGGSRFQIAKGKTKISTGTSKNIPRNQKALPPSSSIVKTQKNKLLNDKVQFVVIKDITEKTDKVSKKSANGNFDTIKKTLDSILEILKSKFKFDEKQSDKERREKETEKRSKRESALEGFKKGISGIVSVTKKILSPFQNLIDRIFKFIFFTLLGKAFTKFMEWMQDKGNQEKFNSFIEFLNSHWPALAGLYILFGTSFGKLVRGLLKSVARMTVALVMNIGKIKRFITKNKKLAFLGAAIAPLASRELGNIFGKNEETPESGLIPKDGADLGDAKKSVDDIKGAQVSKLNLGGMVPKFNLGGMIPSFVRGGFNPYGMGMDFGAGVPIRGAGQDDTLITAKSGEAILTERDQQDINQRYVDRITGQPLNIPQYLSGRKPGSVAMSNLRFPGGAFFDGGIVSKFNNGGIVGGKNKIQNPKISAADYNALLALSALEDTNPQGRADVAQSLYNRMFAAQRYGINFNQNSSALKDIITAGGGRDTGGQYEPTFGNKSDWLNIKDRMSAAVAIMNSEKGKRYKWDINEALRQLNATEAALRNPAFQSAAQKHVGGRTYFLGTSQQSNMKPGDVLRSPEQNFFSPWYTEGTPYDKQRRNIAAPIPEMLIPKQNSNKQRKKSLLERVVGGAQRGLSSLFNMGRGAVARPIKKQGGGLVDPSIQSMTLGGGGGGTDAITEQATDMPFVDRLKRFLFGKPKPKHDPQEYKGGGPVKENTGMNILGATADRQRVDLHPGEYVFPKDAVERLGGSKVLDRLVASLDKDSTPFKQGVLNRPPIKPYSQNVIGGMMTLPPMNIGTSGSSPRASGLAGGSEVPSFSARHPNGEHSINAKMYGLIG